MTEADDGDDAVDLFAQRYPPAEMSAADFERFVVELFSSASPFVNNLRVALHESVEGVDGTYDFDATVRFDLGGMAFLVVIEAKHHSNPIKREPVQVLHSKCQSVGAHKGVLITTARFQRGAIDYAKVHGIALVGMTEGRFTYETRSILSPAPMTREEADDLFGLPTFVGHCYGAGDAPDSMSITLMSPEYGDLVVEQLLGLPRPE